MGKVSRVRHSAAPQQGAARQSNATARPALIHRLPYFMACRLSDDWGLPPNVTQDFDECLEIWLLSSSSKQKSNARADHSIPWPSSFSCFQSAEAPPGEVLPDSAFTSFSPGYGQVVLRTTATKIPNVVLPFFSHLKPPGAPRGLPFAAGKNSAPRARRPQPRRNAGQSAGAGSKGPAVGEGRVRLRPTRPNRLKQLPVVKRQPPGHPFSWFQSAEGAQKMVFQPGVHLSSPPGGSKTPWTGAPELSEAVSDRWPGQYPA